MYCVFWLSTAAVTFYIEYLARFFISNVRRKWNEIPW